MSDGEVEALGLRGKRNYRLLMTSRTLPILARTLAVVTATDYVWLRLGSSLYHRVTSSNKSQPEMFGGITNAKDWLALAAVPVVGERDGSNDSIVSMMVDRGAWDTASMIIPPSNRNTNNSTIRTLWHRRRAQPQEDTNSRGSDKDCCAGMSSEAEVRCLIQNSCLVAPGCQDNLFPVKQGTHNQWSRIRRRHGQSTTEGEHDKEGNKGRKIESCQRSTRTICHWRPTISSSLSSSQGAIFTFSHSNSPAVAARVIWRFKLQIHHGIGEVDI